MISLRSLLLFALSGAPASAQDWSAGAVARTIELPAHEALMKSTADSETALAPFQTDGCSGGLSEVWKVVAGRFPDFAEAHQSLPPWEGCCVTHDRANHDVGGAADAGGSFEARLNADRALEACVVAIGADRVDALADVYDVNTDQIEAAYRSIAQAMFLAVRFGGAPCSGLPWRWGYGYPACTVLTAVID